MINKAVIGAFDANFGFVRVAVTEAIRMRRKTPDGKIETKLQSLCDSAKVRFNEG